MVSGFFSDVFLSQEVAMVVFGSIPSVPVVLYHCGALDDVIFYPLLADLEAKYSLNSSGQKGRR